MWFSIDVIEGIIETGVEHKYYYRFSGCFQVQLGEILDHLTVGHFVTAERPKIVLFPRQKSFFFTFSWSGRPISPHICIAKSFYKLILHFKSCC
jgi:hypothetical protein